MTRQMDDPTSVTGLTRRELIRAGALGAGALALFAEPCLGEKRPYGPFEMGIQSFSLRRYGLDEALAKTRGLGLRYWEAYPAHVPETDDPQRIRDMLARFQASDVHLRAWGVVGFDGDEARTRRTLEFARAMGIAVISADPSPESFPVLDRLLPDFPQAYVAIHNHGPGARYAKIADVASAIAGRHERIGACVDTGHYLRSGEDPVQAVKMFGSRTYGVHLKEVKNGTDFTELGSGDLRLVDLLRALRKLKFGHTMSLEYEEHEQNPIGYIAECLVTAREAVRKMGRR